MKLQKGGEQRMEQAQVQGQQQVQKEFTDDVVWCGGKKKQKGVRSEKRYKAFCKKIGITWTRPIRSNPL